MSLPICTRCFDILVWFPGCRDIVAPALPPPCHPRTACSAFLHFCSGLDSKTAEDLISTLQRLAHGGRTVMCSVHQPSPEIFGLFDRLVFLADGHVLFDGPARSVPDYFNKIGHDVPPEENPADFIMEVVSSRGEVGGNSDGVLRDDCLPHYSICLSICIYIYSFLGD